MSNYSRVSRFPPLKCLWQQRSVSSRRQRVLPRTQSNESRWSSASSKGTPLNRIFQCGELQAICATCSQKEVKEHQPTDEQAASASDLDCELSIGTAGVRRKFAGAVREVVGLRWRKGVRKGCRRR